MLTTLSLSPLLSLLKWPVLTVTQCNQLFKTGKFPLMICWADQNLRLPCQFMLETAQHSTVIAMKIMKPKNKLVS